jgi:Rieske 2Fe-2S family protein
MAQLVGIWGHPFINLEALLDMRPLPEMHEEICYSLARVGLSYTGGNLKWQKVVAPGVAADSYADYGQVISRFSKEEFVRFIQLAQDPQDFDVERYQEYEFGDETENPLTTEQLLYLKYRYGVYFPWKVAYHLIENDFWEDKNSGAGKGFLPEAEELFPKTCDYLRRLPFTQIGRCLIFGVEANDHAPLHRDTEPGSKPEIDHCITICPTGEKRFYLSATGSGDERTPVTAKLYWFNDMDWHGVAPGPSFTYSIRADGVFDPIFLRMLERRFRK